MSPSRGQARSIAERWLAAVALVGLFALVGSVETALGHETCTPNPCLEPRRGGPDTKVTGDFETWKIVWNEQLRMPPISYRYDPDVGTIILHESPDRTLQSELTFSVPDVPPGTYAVVFYQADEDYQHYFWDRFTVTATYSRVEGALGWLATLIVLVVAVAVRRRRTGAQ